jgi:hypothetical protein
MGTGLAAPCCGQTLCQIGSVFGMVIIFKSCIKQNDRHDFIDRYLVHTVRIAVITKKFIATR